MPVRIFRFNKGEEIRRQINCQFTSFSHAYTLLFDPGNHLLSPRGRCYSGENGKTVTEQVETFAAINFIRPESIVRLVFYHKTFVDMMVYRSTGNGKPPHSLAYPVCSFVLAQKPKIAIYQCVYKQSISGHPLFIAPIACGLLCNQVTV